MPEGAARDEPKADHEPRGAQQCSPKAAKTLGSTRRSSPPPALGPRLPLSEPSEQVAPHRAFCDALPHLGSLPEASGQAPRCLLQKRGNFTGEPPTHNSTVVPAARVIGARPRPAGAGADRSAPGAEPVGSRSRSRARPDCPRSSYPWGVHLLGGVLHHACQERYWPDGHEISRPPFRRLAPESTGMNRSTPPVVIASKPRGNLSSSGLG
jgi:hypothetical protein